MDSGLQSALCVLLDAQDVPFKSSAVKHYLPAKKGCLPVTSLASGPSSKDGPRPTWPGAKRCHA